MKTVSNSMPHIALRLGSMGSSRDLALLFERKLYIFRTD